MDIPIVVSLVVGFVSLVIAAIAMALGLLAQRESRSNYDRTKEVLAEIDKRAAVIEKTVTESERQLLETVRRLVIPEKPDIGEQVGIEMAKAMFDDPDKITNMMKTMKELQDISPANSDTK